MSQASLFLDEPDAAAASSEFDDLTGDGGVLKRTLFPGTGAAPPADAVALLHHSPFSLRKGCVAVTGFQT